MINYKLYIRVGAGYMIAEEFINQYGKKEMMKEKKQEELLSIDNPVSLGLRVS
jgi:hypothetical protein